MKKKLVIFITLLLSVVMVAGCSCAASKKDGKTVEPTKTEQTVYQLGDKMDDFEVILSDGTKTSLYGLLGEKKAVLINFWASWCGPCKMEFPFMQAAYDQMSDQISVIALSVEPSDTDEVVLSLKEELGLTTLPMGLDSGLSARFAVEAYPTSVMVDRNGVVCFIEAGSIPSTEKFLRLFTVFTAKDYSEPVLLNSVPTQLPNVESPTVEALSAALNVTGDAVTISLSTDPYAWPFTVSKDGSYVEASNADVLESKAVLTISVKTDKGGALAFDYAVSSSSIDSLLTVDADGKTVIAYSGDVAWSTDCVRFDEAGEHTVTFMNTHSEYTQATTSATLRNLRVVSAEEATKLEAAKPSSPAKTLTGETCEIEVLKGDMKPAEINEVDAEGEGYPISILGDDSMTLRIKLGTEVNDTLAFVNDNDTYKMICNLPQDGQGYLYEYHKGSTAEKGPFGNTFEVYASVLNISAEKIGSLNWCDSEADMDACVACMKEIMEGFGQGEVNLAWRYTDGSDRTEPVAETPKSTTAGTSGQYVITVTDEAGKGLEGVTVQICDESTCQVFKTDKSGLISQTMNPYPYEVHLLVVPEGYERPTDTYTLPETGGDLVIKLKKVA